MPTITYLLPDESSVELEVAEGITVMRAALSNGVRGIVGECGGQAMCATCHVFVRSAGAELPDISEDEDEMLDCTASQRTDSSRLGCQITLGGELQSLSVEIPAEQI